MSGIRPPSWPQVPAVRPQTQPTNARAAAQKAFFEAALSGQASPSAARTAQASYTQKPAAPELAPDRVLKPGSIINILV